MRRLGSVNARQIPYQGIVSPTSVSIAVDMEFCIPDHPPMMLANQTEARALSGAWSGVAGIRNSGVRSLRQSCCSGASSGVEVRVSGKILLSKG